MIGARLRVAGFSRAHRRAIAMTLVTMIAVGATALWWSLPASVDTYAAMREDIVQSVVVTGQVISPQRASISSEFTARVARVLVDQGATVARGQPLIELDTADERAAVAQAQAALTQAQSRVRQIASAALPGARETLRQARANATQARAAFDRTQDLVARNFVSRAQLDDAQRNLEVAESQVQAAELSVASNSPGGGDFEMAAAGTNEARAGLGVAQARLEATTIRAPATGTLIARSVEQGDVAQAGKELMVLASAGDTQVVANVDEKNLGKLELGQAALVSADAYPERSFHAELFYVNPGVDVVRGTVETKLRVTDPPAYLCQDMTVSVDIEVGRRERVVVVPANAVHDLATAHPWVLVVRGGRAVRAPVVIGMRGDATVEVAQGITVGDAVVPVTDSRVSAGDRVRARGPARIAP